VGRIKTTKLENLTNTCRVPHCFRGRCCVVCDVWYLVFLKAVCLTCIFCELSRDTRIYVYVCVHFSSNHVDLHEFIYP